MSYPRRLGTTAPKTESHTSVAPAGWVTETTSFVADYVELTSDIRAMEAEIERYGKQPAEGFTRLDDFLAELDG